MAKIKNRTVLPDWFLIAKHDALFDSSDVALIFGYASRKEIYTAVKYGIFPKASFDMPTLSGRKNSKRMWSKTDILKEIKRRDNL